jgi:hypothetical protein
MIIGVPPEIRTVHLPITSLERWFYANILPKMLDTCFHAGLLLCLFFDPEDGGDMFLRIVGWLSTDYTTLYPKRQNS